MHIEYIQSWTIFIYFLYCWVYTWVVYPLSIVIRYTPYHIPICLLDHHSRLQTCPHFAEVPIAALMETPGGFFFREADVENNGYKWLVGGFLEKYEFVNGKDDNPYMKWKIKMLETTNQIYRYKWYWHYYPIGQTNTDVDKKHGFLRKKKVKKPSATRGFSDLMSV